jgi:hypothetical protein
MVASSIVSDYVDKLMILLAILNRFQVGQREARAASLGLIALH